MYSRFAKRCVLVIAGSEPGVHVKRETLTAGGCKACAIASTCAGVKDTSEAMLGTELKAAVICCDVRPILVELAKAPWQAAQLVA